MLEQNPSSSVVMKTWCRTVEFLTLYPLPKYDIISMDVGSQKLLNAKFEEFILLYRR